MCTSMNVLKEKANLIQLNKELISMLLQHSKIRLQKKHENEIFSYAIRWYAQKEQLSLINGSFYSNQDMKKFYVLKRKVSSLFLIMAIFLFGLLIAPAWISLPKIPSFLGIMIFFGGLIGAPILLTTSILIYQETPNWLIRRVKITPVISFDDLFSYIYNLNHNSSLWEDHK